MNIIIPLFALFFTACCLIRETKTISNIAHVLSGVSNVIDFNGKKEKETELNQTRFVFYIKWDATM